MYGNLHLPARWLLPSRRAALGLGPPARTDDFTCIFKGEFSLRLSARFSLSAPYILLTPSPGSPQSRCFIPCIFSVCTLAARLVAGPGLVRERGWSGAGRGRAGRRPPCRARYCASNQESYWFSRVTPSVVAPGVGCDRTGRTQRVSPRDPPRSAPFRPIPYRRRLDSVRLHPPTLHTVRLTPVSGPGRPGPGVESDRVAPRQPRRRAAAPSGRNAATPRPKAHPSSVQPARPQDWPISGRPGGLAGFGRGVAVVPDSARQPSGSPQAAGLANPLPPPVFHPAQHSAPRSRQCTQRPSLDDYIADNQLINYHKKKILKNPTGA